MISVIVPTLNAEHGLPEALSALVPAAVEGIVRQVIVTDGGSSDGTLTIADQAGAEIVRAERGRGCQLIAGAGKATQPWLLFLHADTVLEPGWEREAARFIERVDIGSHPLAAASFGFTLNDLGLKPRIIEAGVTVRCHLLGLPYGDQGLLIPRRLYDQIGGYKPLSIMEDVEVVRRLGRRRLVMLRAKATTSATRYRHDGYSRRVLRNLTCLSLFFLRAPNSWIMKLYGPAGKTAPDAGGRDKRMTAE